MRLIPSITAAPPEQRNVAPDMNQEIHRIHDYINDGILTKEERERPI